MTAYGNRICHQEEKILICAVMKMMDHETLVSTSDSGTLTLTNRRIRQLLGDNGISILLENIQSVSIRYKSYPVLLTLGLFFLVLSLGGLNGSQEILQAGIPIGIILLLIYAFTRKHVMVISSPGENIEIMITGKESKIVIDMVDLIEETICKRKHELYTHS